MQQAISASSVTSSADGVTFREDAELTISEQAREQQAKAEAARARRQQGKTASYASEAVPPTHPVSLRSWSEPEPEPEPEKNPSSEWEVLIDDTGETYYYNAVTGTRSSQPPDGWTGGPQSIAEGFKINPDSDWAEYDDTDGTPYYSNTKTGDTVWEMPPEGVSSSERLDKMAATSQ